MDAIDGTGHYERTTETPPPSLLVIVLDTNPYAWASLSPSLPLSKAIAELLVFINAHLAFNHANRVAVIASHCQRTAWLYPTPTDHNVRVGPNKHFENGDEDISEDSATKVPSNPNKYRPFALIEHEVLHNLRALLATTDASDLVASPTTTMIAGALTLALSYINKTAATISSAVANPSTTSNPDAANRASSLQSGQQSHLNSRVLIVSTSGDLATQYIPVMNVIFAAQQSGIPIDILKLAGDTVLLQQASYTTSGVFLSPISLQRTDGDDDTAQEENQQQPVSLLSTLLFAFLPDTTARSHLIPPTGTNIDFRAACFCHRRVVDIGYVCSICLSIFCEEGVDIGIRADASDQGGQAPGVDKATGACLTCGTKLSLKVLTGGAAGSELVLDDRPRKKKKKKRREGEGGTPLPSGIGGGG